MLLLPAVQLHDQLAGMDEPFVVRPAVVALAAEQPLIPPAAGLDISDADQRLRSHHVASPYRTPSHTVGSSGVVQSTRCFLKAGMFMKSPGFISTMPSSNCNLAAPFKHDDPLVLRLVVPEVGGRGVAVRDDPLDLHVAGTEENLDEFLGQVLRQVIEDVGRHDYFSFAAVTRLLGYFVTVSHASSCSERLNLSSHASRLAFFNIAGHRQAHGTLAIENCEVHVGIKGFHWAEG